MRGLPSLRGGSAGEIADSLLHGLHHEAKQTQINLELLKERFGTYKGQMSPHMVLNLTDSSESADYSLNGEALKTEYYKLEPNSLEG